MSNNKFGLLLSLLSLLPLPESAFSAPPGVEAKKPIEKEVSGSPDPEMAILEEAHREMGSPEGVMVLIRTTEAGVATSREGIYIFPRWWLQEVGEGEVLATWAHEIAHVEAGHPEEAALRMEAARGFWGRLGVGARERSEISQDAELTADLDGLAIYEGRMKGEYYLPHLYLGVEAHPRIKQGEHPSHPPRETRWRALAAILY